MNRQKFMRKFFKSTKKSLLDDFDLYIQKDMENAFERAKDFLALENEDISAHRPIATNAPEALNRDLKSKFIYHENKIRFDVGRYYTLMFGDNLMHFYTSIINHETGEIYNDLGVSVPYSRIKTIQTSLLFKHKLKRNHHVYELRIAVDGMKDINLVLRNIVVDNETPDAQFVIGDKLKEVSEDLLFFLRDRLV